MSRLVFVPCAAALARELRQERSAGPWLAFTPSAGLAAQVGDAGPEELEYAALNCAGVARLVDPSASDPRRLILAAEVPEAQLVDLDAAEPGTVTVGQLSWKQVIAMFTDDYEAAEAVRAARAAVRGRTVSEALAAPEVVALLEGHDLLWYAPAELDRLS